MVLSSPVLVTVAKIPAALTLNAEYIMPDGTPQIHYSGRLTRADTGAGLAFKPLEVYVIKPDGTPWSYTTNTIPDGLYEGYIYLDVIEPGEWTIQTEFLGDETFEGCDENRRTLLAKFILS